MKKVKRFYFITFQRPMSVNKTPQAGK